MANDIRGLVDHTTGVEILDADARYLQYASVGVYGTEPTFTDNNDGTASLGGFDVTLKTNTNGLTTIRKYTIASSGPHSFTDGGSEYVYVDYNSGTPLVAVTNDYTIFDEATKVPIFKCWRVGNTVHSLSGDAAGVGLSNKISTMLQSTHPYNRAGNSGLVISEVTSPNPRTITVTQSYVYAGTFPQLVSSFTSATDRFTKATVASSTWTYSSTALVYDNTDYNPTTGPVALGNNNYGVRWFYRSIGDVKEVFYVLGTGDHVKEADAWLETERTDLPPVIKQHCVLIGRAVIRKSATSGTTQSLLVNTYAGATITSHNDLNNIQGGTTGAYYHSDKPLDAIFSDTDFTTGILNIHTSSTSQRVNTTLAFDNSTHVFTIAPAGGSYTSFDIYLSGIKTTFNADVTIDLDTVGLVTDTLYFIYFTDVGGVATIQASTTPWEINSNAAPIATVFWNGTTGFIGDERHDARRNLVDHKYKHQNLGTQWTSGFEGTFNPDGTFSIAAGRLADEEIVLVSASPVTSARVWYTTTGPKATVNGDTSVCAYVDVGDVLKYNPTSTYTLTAVTDGYYIRNYIYGTNDTTLPIALIVGQNEYNNVNDARTDSFPVSPTYINNEVKLLFTSIWKNVGGVATFVEATDYRSAPSQANGTLAIRPTFLDELQDVFAPTPSLDQVLRWNGSAWVNGSPATSSAGAGIEFFNASPTITATGTNNAIVINTLSKTPVTTTEQTLASSLTAAGGVTPLSAWLYNTALGRTSIDAGTWTFSQYAGVSSVGGGRVTTMSRGVYSVLPQDGAAFTVTTTNDTATTKIATASGGTPFATTKITASLTKTDASYLQTPQGLYQIIERTSDTVVKIAVPSGYANEAAVVFNVWKLLFNTGTIGPITSISPTYNLYSVTSAQSAFTVTALHKLGAISFGVSNNTTTLTTVYDGSTHNTHFDSPLIILHNDLAGLQGGTANNFHHLSSLTTINSGLTMSTNSSLGRLSASTGGIEEIPLIEQWVLARPGPTSAGTKGQMYYEQPYLYQCVGPSQWVRNVVEYTGWTA